MDRHLLPGFAVFVEVAESLSFSQAANRLSVKASSISRTVARLESELGVKLLRRTSRAVSLTFVRRGFENLASSASPRRTICRITRSRDNPTIC